MVVAAAAARAVAVAAHAVQPVAAEATKAATALPVANLPAAETVANTKATTFLPVAKHQKALLRLLRVVWVKLAEMTLVVATATSPTAVTKALKPIIIKNKIPLLSGIF